MFFFLTLKNTTELGLLRETTAGKIIDDMLGEHLLLQFNDKENKEASQNGNKIIEDENLKEQSADENKEKQASLEHVERKPKPQNMVFKPKKIDTDYQ